MAGGGGQQGASAPAQGANPAASPAASPAANPTASPAVNPNANANPMGQQRAQYQGQNFLNSLQNYAQQGGDLSALQNSPYASHLMQQLHNSQGNQQKFQQSQTMGSAQQQPAAQTPTGQTMGSTNPTPYQGSAAPQNLGQAAGTQGFNGNSPVSAGYQQMQNNAIQGALGGLNPMQANATGPNVFGGGVNPAAGGPYGGFNPQGMPPQSGTAMFQGPPNAYGSGGTQGYAHSGAMQYNPQGQQPPTIGATPQNQNFMTGADSTGNMPGGNMGFDNSGSDGGVGGRPAPMQTPFAPQGGKMRGGPPMMSDYRPQKGLQIQGNPTAQSVGGMTTNQFGGGGPTMEQMRAMGYGTPDKPMPM